MVVPYEGGWFEIQVCGMPADAYGHVLFHLAEPFCAPILLTGGRKTPCSPITSYVVISCL